MGKRLLSVLLALCLALALLPGTARAVSYPVTGGYIGFSETLGAVTACDPSVTAAVIPSEINGVPVTAIARGAFSNCSELTSVVIPDSVTKIDWYAFQNCTSLTSVTIGSGVTSIGFSAFERCDSLTGLTIPASVTKIDPSAFQGSYNLANIDVSSGNPAYSSMDGVLFNKDQTLLQTYPEGKSGTVYRVPDTVTDIGNHAFANVRSLTGVILPDGVTSIGSGAFAGCNNLIGLTIPDSVTDIGEYAFSACLSMTSITIPAGVTVIESETFYDCNSLTDVYYGGSESQWKQIKISDKKNDPLLSAAIHYNSKGPDVPVSPGGPESTHPGSASAPGPVLPALQKTFRVDFDNGSAYVQWDDGWFQNPATTYIHDLAVASAALSAASYSIDKIDSVLKSLDFDDIRSQDYDWTVSANGKAGYTLAHKTVSSGNETFTLVAVVVRGSKNTADWVSNFLDSGMFDGNSGFEDAAKGIMQTLNTYCAETGISGSDNVKFLVTGHSRGGLIANLIAADLSTRNVLNGVHLDQYTRSANVFGYTFASPKPSTGAVRLPCSNIWNIINYPDVVPKVPINSSPRYGTDLYLPHKKYYASKGNYSEFTGPMLAEYWRLTGNYYEESYTLSNVLIGDRPLPYIFSVHGIAAYYSWLSSYTADELFGTTKNPTYKELTIACPVDVFVYDAAGAPVAGIVNDEVVVDILAAEVVADDPGPETQEKIKKICLPTDQTYSVEIRATGTGTVSYTVREIEVSCEEGLSGADGQSTGTADRILRIVGFGPIDIEAGDELTAEIDSMFRTDKRNYSLTKNGDTVIEPDRDSVYQIAGSPENAPVEDVFAPDNPKAGDDGNDLLFWLPMTAVMGVGIVSLAVNAKKRRSKSH